MEKKEYGFKTILWGTLIVSLVPSTFLFFKRWILGEQDDSFDIVFLDYLRSSLFSTIVTFSIFIAFSLVISNATAKLEGKVSSTQRILICLFFSLIAANIIIFIEWKIFNAIVFKTSGAEEREHIFENQLLATVLVIIVSLVFEIGHYIDKLKITMAEKERLEKENINAQLESLKTQLSPHFLFNSFNALQSLIDSDTEKAKEFLHELAKVYRYVLDQKDSLVVEVKHELNFIYSYIYLNKIRFGDNLIFETQLDAEVFKKFIPPLTLQAIIENAIKHNIISEEKPLTISIKNDDECLLVINNFQLRNEKIVSTGIGLANLKERYQLLINKKPDFSVAGGQYIARIPLIEKEI